MDASSFEFHLTVPADAAFGVVVHALVAKAGTFAGCAPATASAFADAVVAAVAGLDAGSAADVQCQRQRGRIEVAVTGEAAGAPVAETRDGGAVQVRCRQDHGRWICTIAMDA